MSTSPILPVVPKKLLNLTTELKHIIIIYFKH